VSGYSKVAALVTSLCLAACNSDRNPPLPRGDSVAVALIREVKRVGAKRMVDSMFRDHSFGDMIDSGITTGDSAWLVLARRLKAVSDGGISEELEMSLGAALPKAPEAVLRILDDTLAHFDIGWVCRDEIVMDDVDTARASAINRAHHIAAVAALRTVRSPDLLARRDSCATILGPAR